MTTIHLCAHTRRRCYECYDTQHFYYTKVATLFITVVYIYQRELMSLVSLSKVNKFFETNVIAVG